MVVSSGLSSLCCCLSVLRRPLRSLWGGVLLRSRVLGPSALAGLHTVGGSKPSGDEARLEFGFPGLSGEVHIRTPRSRYLLRDRQRSANHEGRLSFHRTHQNHVFRKSARRQGAKLIVVERGCRESTNHDVYQKTTNNCKNTHI